MGMEELLGHTHHHGICWHPLTQAFPVAFLMLTINILRSLGICLSYAM
jgi:hypothetical protein